MALFRRGANGRTAQDVSESDVEAPGEVAEEPFDSTEDPAQTAADAPTTDDAPAVDADGPADRSAGPWDAGEEVPPGPRVDLGALQLPGVHGMELRMEVDKASSTVTAVGVTVDGSTLQLQAFAAPRSEGIWTEIRGEIAESVRKQGGSVDDVPGPFGRELLARLPVRTPEGRTGHRPARFVGVDGPRWFLRGVLTGRAAVDAEAAATLEDLFRRTIVVRGTQARAPRDLLALSLPGQADGVTTSPPPAAPTFDPLKRGPEITEIR